MSRRSACTTWLRDVVLSECADSSHRRSRLRKTNRLADNVSDGQITDNFLSSSPSTLTTDEMMGVDPPLVAATRHLPPEVWDLLASHVAPEDVGRFSAVCRAAYRATLRPQFWRCLLRRHVPSACMRVRWQGGSSVAPSQWPPLRGLRALVVRMLHRWHAPLSRRVFGVDTHVLVGAQCCHAWSLDASTAAVSGVAGGAAATRSLLCLVLRSNSASRSSTAPYHERLAPCSSTQALTRRRLLFENADEQVLALVVVGEAGAVSADRLTAVFGLTVRRVAVTVGACVRRRLTVDFSHSGYRQGGERAPAEYQPRRLVVDGVVDVRVVRWWHGEFTRLMPVQYELPPSPMHWQHDDKEWWHNESPPYE